MSFKPIPKKLLIHEIDYIPRKTSNSGWGGQGKEKPQHIKRVRFEPSSEVRKTGVNEENLVKGVLFIDAKNSKPFIVPVVKSTIFFENEKLTVQSCEPIYDTRKRPHHVEVVLV